MAEDDDPGDEAQKDANRCDNWDEGAKAERVALMDFVNGCEDVRAGVYEGGLKSWECSVDLVQWLAAQEGLGTGGGRVLEVSLNIHWFLAANIDEEGMCSSVVELHFPLSSFSSQPSVRLLLPPRLRQSLVQSSRSTLQTTTTLSSVSSPCPISSSPGSFLLIHHS